MRRSAFTVISASQQVRRRLTSLLDARAAVEVLRLSRSTSRRRAFPGLTAALLVALIVAVRVIWTPGGRRTVRSRRACSAPARSLSQLDSVPWCSAHGRSRPEHRCCRPRRAEAVVDRRHAACAAFALIPRFPGAWQRRSPLMFGDSAISPALPVTPARINEPFMPGHAA